jgi:GH25 family lysozyme M1 (1,4-beta-N-acetylmuramidase)
MKKQKLSSIAPLARTHCLGLVCATILLLPLQPSRTYGAGPYQYTIVATSGQAGISALLSGPSINNRGLCAFTAQVAGGQSVYVGDGSADPTDINDLVSSSRTFSSYLQINDDGVVVTEDTVPGPYTTIRAYIPNPRYGWVIVADANTTNFVATPAIDNVGQVAYLGFDFESGYHLYSTNLSRRESFYEADLGNNLYRPMIADSGAVVGKLGSATTSGSIVVFDGTLGGPVDVATAGSGEPFTSLDSLPGISQDGQVVAFSGVDASGQPGIFIVVANAGTFSSSTPFRVAGIDDGFDSFATFSRVAVRTDPANPVSGTVAFIGTQDGTLGLYVVVFLATPAIGVVDTTPPVAVASVGQSFSSDLNLNGISGTVRGLGIQDPLNTNGNVAFFAQSSSGVQAIIEATPPILGVDVSHYNDDYPEVGQGIAWYEVYAAGKRFAFVKCTEGQTTADGGRPGGPNDWFTPNITGAVGANLLAGAYHIARFSDVHQAYMEALFFLSRATDYIGPKFLPPALDLETDFFQKPHPQDVPDVITNWLWLVQCKTSVKPMIYLSKDSIKSLPAGIVPNYDLWVGKQDINPYGFQGLGGQFKQYQIANCPGITGNAGKTDLDSFEGSMDDLLALYHEDPVPPETSAPTFSGYSRTTTPDGDTVFFYSDILPYASNPGGGAPDICGADGQSKQGGVVQILRVTQGVLYDELILYTPKFGFTGQDSFNVWLSDYWGPTNKHAKINVTVLKLRPEPIARQVGVPAAQ